MSNRRLNKKPPLKTEQNDKAKIAQRETTYNQPTKGFKFTPMELENLEKLVKSLRKSTGENVTLNKLVRGFSYLANDKATITALESIIIERF